MIATVKKNVKRNAARSAAKSLVKNAARKTTAVIMSIINRARGMAAFIAC